MEQIVTGCKDCPMYAEGEGYTFLGDCQHPNLNTYGNQPLLENGTKIPITPDWCPLKTEPITISIKQ